MVAWRDQPIRNADPSTFELLGGILARDARRVFVLGKPFPVHHASFEVLSPVYARDHDAVYVVMESKIKQLAGADPASFRAIGERYGADSTHAYCFDKQVHLTRYARPQDLRELAPGFATDGNILFCGTKPEPIPAAWLPDWSRARMKVFGSGLRSANCPRLVLSDDKAVLVRFSQCFQVEDRFTYWQRLVGTCFETLAPLPCPPWRDFSLYMADDCRIWFAGVPMADVAPNGARALAHHVLDAQGRIYGGAMPTDLLPAEQLSGNVFRRGDQILELYAGGGMAELASVPGDLPDIEQAIAVALTEAFTILFTVFDHCRPIEWRPYGVDQWFELGRHIGTPAGPVRSELPALSFAWFGQGRVAVRFGDGREIVEPLSGWYTLACRAWAAERGQDVSFMPYPALGGMEPDGGEFVERILGVLAVPMLHLARAAFHAGAAHEARIIAHLFLNASDTQRLPDSALWQLLACLPRELLEERHYLPARHSSGLTTFLGLGRRACEPQMLHDGNWRVRLHAAGTAHMAIVDTGRHDAMFRSVVPALIARYEVEMEPVVRERLAMALEAALVECQVRAEVGREYHHATLLPCIQFCLAKGINTRFNRCRLAEALWALDRDDEALALEASVLGEVGEMAPVSGVYVDRRPIRCHRIWFLMARVRMAWRPATSGERKRRAARLQQAWLDLLDQFGPGAAQCWPELGDLRDDIAEYVRSAAGAEAASDV